MSEIKNQQAIRTMARGAGIVFIGMIFARIFGYILRVTLKRSIGLDNFGLISTGVVVVELATIVALMGLQVATARYIAFFNTQRASDKVAGTLKSALLIGMTSLTIMSLFIFIFAEQISIHLFEKPDLHSILRYFWVLVPVWGFVLLAASIMRGFKNMSGTIITQQIGRPFFVLICFGVLMLWDVNLSTAVWGYFFGFVFTAFIALMILVRTTPFTFFIKLPSTNLIKEILTYSWPLVFATILWNMTGRMGTFFLSIYESKTQVGIFSVVLPLSQFVAIAMQSFSMILMPLFSGSFSTNNLTQLRLMYNASTKWILFFTAMVFVPVFVYSVDLLILFFGADTASGALALKLISAGYLIYAVIGPCNLVLNAAAKTKYVFVNTLIAFLMNIIISVIFIPKYGVNGAAIATIGSFIAVNFFAFAQNYVFFKVTPFRGPFFKSIIALALGFGMVYLTRPFLAATGSVLMIISGVLVFIIVYTLFLYIFRVFDNDDLVIIVALEKRFGRRFTLLRRFIRT